MPGAPDLVSTIASPRPVVWLIAGNGLLRHASSMRMRILFGTEFNVFSTSFSRTACSGMSASRFGSTSIGTRKFSPSTWMPCPA